MSSEIIILEPQHIEFADSIAAKRQAAAVEKGRRPHNGAPTAPDAALAISILGTRCECAAYLWAKPVKWHTFADQVGGLPDLDEFIDVKGVGRASDRLIVQLDDDERWAYLLVLAHNHPQYAIKGWLWGHEAKRKEFLWDGGKGRPAYFVPQEALDHEPSELLTILRQTGGSQCG